MFVPLYDKNAVNNIHFQYVTFGLIALNVFIFVVYQSGLVYPADLAAASSFAVVPGQLFSEGLFGPVEVQAQHDGVLVAEKWTLLTYMFLHGGWMHLIGNMAFLWVFGDNVEDALGHFRFLIFYLVCGVVAGLTHAYMMPSSELPLVGASGAVAGVIMAYLMLHPKVQVWVLVLWRFPIPISAGFALGFWVLLQIVNVVMAPGDNIAWWAHIGGLVAGGILVIFMRRPGVPLFDRTSIETV